MLGATVDQVKTIAVVAVVAFVVLAVLSAWLMKTVVLKVVSALVFGGLALVVWTQRTSLVDCADQVRADREATCSFVGRDVDVP